MRRRLPLWTPLFVGALALLFAPDCASPESTGSAGGGGGDGASEEALNTPDGVVLAAAVWTLAWDTEGISFPASGGLDLDTDLGYHVHVDVGRVLLHSVAFGPCDSASSSTGGAGGSGGSGGSGQTSFFGLPTFFQRLAREGLPVRTARAHADGNEPSTIEASLIEDLTKPTETNVDTSFSASRYCRAHSLVARPMTATQGPSDVSMDQRSLYVTGTYERGGVTAPFTIDTWWPMGSLQDLKEILGEEVYTSAQADGASRHAFVTVRRSIGTLFDGIDFEVASKDQIAGRALDNLGESVHYDITLWRPGDSP